MSDMRASAAAEVAADLIRSAATLWAKRAAILDGVTAQADRAEVRAAEATASAADAAGHEASADARMREGAASAGAAALSATQAATSATGAAASAATASARAGEASASAASAAASASVAAGVGYSMSICNEAGVPAGIYYLCPIRHAGPYGWLRAEVISGSAGASVSFWVLVNDAPVLALRTVVLGTPLILTGLALAVPAGARIDVVILDAPGVTEFFLEIAK